MRLPKQLKNKMEKHIEEEEIWSTAEKTWEEENLTCILLGDIKEFRGKLNSTEILEILQGLSALFYGFKSMEFSEDL